MSVIAMIPAHDEAGGIDSAIASLAGQAVAVDELHGLLERLQSSEYARYAREAGRRHGKAPAMDLLEDLEF